MPLKNTGEIQVYKRRAKTVYSPEQDTLFVDKLLALANPLNSRPVVQDSLFVENLAQTQAYPLKSRRSYNFGMLVWLRRSSKNSPLSSALAAG